MQYINKSLLDIDKELSKIPTQVELDGDTLDIAQVRSVAQHNNPVSLSNNPEITKRIQVCYDMMMQNVRDGVPIYGCNTGFGAQASHVVAEGTPEERLEMARKISSSIQHVDVTTGTPFNREITRAAMTIRINMLMKGVSGVKIQDLELYRDVLNAQITPIVGQYGGVGASGDLAHNARILSALRQLPGTKVWDAEGNIRDAREVLSNQHFSPLVLDPKAGLGFVNGDNFSSALCLLLTVETLENFLLSIISSAMMVEVLRGTNRSFHPLISSIRQHPGQKEVSSYYRYLLDGSQLAFQEMKGHTPRPKGVSVQDGYSLRCLQQFQSGNVERLKSILDTITININSASDNPLWVTPEYATEGEEPWQWVSGGNFLAQYMAESMDQLRKIMTQMVKLNDRHLGRLVNQTHNNGLPANLSGKDAVSQCIFKGVQIQSGMYDVYSSLLSIPVTTFFGVHEENNQDITSHALTSGILGMENARLVRYSLAQNFIAIAQAVDLRGGPDLLSPQTRPVYEYIRSHVSYADKERPLGANIEQMHDEIHSGHLIEYVRKTTFAGYRE